jgi:hypothetical protein
MPKLITPKAFDPGREKDKFLAGLKKKIPKNFDFNSMECLENAMILAYWLYVFKKDGEAMEICGFLEQMKFSGKYDLWSFLENTLALHSRILQEKGSPEESKKCINRINAAGFVKERLDGTQRYNQDIQNAARDGNKTEEKKFRLLDLTELCFMKELGGSKFFPAEKLEQLIQNSITNLRKLSGLE